ncbi:hypothetical protein ACAW74_07945 [Fibrella sp. WM1]|uniref:hypothetical protein n=1 Tax=Fibrella musci TaxID=3242485 RepID=UPI003521D07E
MLQDTPSGIGSGQTIRANAGLGISYFVNNRFSIEATATIGIANVKWAITEKALDPDNRFLLLGIGVNWYLSPRSK